MGRIRAGDLTSLAPHRARSGWTLRADCASTYWLRLPAADDGIFGVLPLLDRWTVDGAGRLLRHGHRVPEAMLPADGWSPVASVLPVGPPARGAPGMPPPAVDFRLEADDAGHPAAALLCQRDAFARWAETAFAARLVPLRFAFADDGRAFVTGVPQPPVPGTGYHRAGRLWLPCGWRLPDHVWQELLEEVLRLGRNRISILHPDGSHEELDEENLLPATRAAVRSTAT